MANNKQVVRRHFEEVWNKGNFEGMNELYDASYEGHVPLVGRVDRGGLKAVVNAYRRAFPDLKFELHDLVHEGDRVAVRWTATGTSRGEFMGIPATNTRGIVEGLSMIEVKNGKIVRDAAEMDVLGFMQQMGLQLPIQTQAQASQQPTMQH